MYDVVIIGSGAAGLSAALSIAPQHKILILSASVNHGANTMLAQGGIAATYEQTRSSIDLHIADTFKAGCGVNDLKATTMLVTESQAAIDFLIENGTQFDTANGTYDLTAEGAHSVRRIFHAEGDSSGKVIYHSLLSAAQSRDNITIKDQAVVYQTAIVEKHTYNVKYRRGNYSYSIDTNNLIISSGGYANLFSASSNSQYINGLNLIIAKQLSLRVSNLHLVQFHPTGFKDNDGHYHLLTESLRGEGARFYTHECGYFMHDYHNLGDVAPRDIASRAVLDQHQLGHQVYLDCRGIDSSIDLDMRFNTVSNVVRKSGYNLRTDLIPVVPVAHYCIGGIDVDVDGQTNMPGVYAVGEAAMSGVHGANRLASNSLLECVVYGMKVGSQITAGNQYPIQELDESNEDNLESVYEQVRNILSKSCNIIRNDQALELALQQLKRLTYQSQAELDVIEIAEKIVNNCLTHQSIGCHYKEKND
ncbi:FAD-dependent oxidoreductase [Mollicutes bacterium LVI A0039]|nr:FAD-dependent oxidoreductase [Mollicutes bacterium LVI A0039]